MTPRDSLRSMVSALEQADFGQEGLHVDGLAIREIVDLSIIRVRALRGTPPSRWSDAELPLQVGACSQAEPRALCLRPGEWLLVGNAKRSENQLSETRRRLDDSEFFTWDETHALAVLRLEGEAAPWLLRKHCGLDLPGQGSDDGQCTRARLAHISMLMHYHINQLAGVYDLFVQRSLARFAWELLVSTAQHALELQNTFDPTSRGRS